MLTHYVQYGILKLTPSTCFDRSRVPDTGRGSRQIVLIEAGGFYPGIYGKPTNAMSVGDVMNEPLQIDQYSNDNDYDFVTIRITVSVLKKCVATVQYGDQHAVL